MSGDLEIALGYVLVGLIIITICLYYFTYVYEEDIMIINSKAIPKLSNSLIRHIARFTKSGYNYFDDFSKKGEKFKYFICWDEYKICATACAILVNLTPNQQAWYICDIHVHPDYHNKHLLYRMFCKASIYCYPTCPFAFTLISDDGEESGKRARRIAKRCGFESTASWPKPDEQLYHYNIPGYAWETLNGEHIF
jgi:hypothetical protein